MTRCPHCHALAVRHPSRAWRLAHAAAWLYAAGSVLGASLVGPMIIGLAVPLLFGGACLLAETHRRASAPGECDACGKYVAHRIAPVMATGPVLRRDAIAAH
jgi:hypothetical protein